MEQEKKFGFGIEISLDSPDDFLKIKETLTRIGIKSKKENILYQSCHIFHKRGLYYIMGFKEFFVLDKKIDNVTEDDLRRRNTIAKLLSEWNMCKVIDKTELEFILPISDIDIIPFKEKKNYTLVAKYQVGNKK